MKRFGIMMLCVFLSAIVFAEKSEPVGFLWYNLPKVASEKPQQTLKPQASVPFSKLSYTERDAVLRFYTMEALHKARYTGSMEDMRSFIALQDYFLKGSSQFSNLFQKTMLFNPQYDYTVTHPTSNLGVKLSDRLRTEENQKRLGVLAKTHGLLFFYRGANPFDQKQIPILETFAKEQGFSLLPISVDGVRSEILPNSRLNEGQTEALGVRFFPAILLVNPATAKTTPVAYGLTTADVLERRLAKFLEDKEE